MKRFLTGLSMLVVAALAACELADRVTAPSPGKTQIQPVASLVCGDQQAFEDLKDLAEDVFIDAHDASAVQGKIDNVFQQCQTQNWTIVVQRTWQIVDFVIEKWKAGRLTSDWSVVQQFISDLLRAAGIAADGWIVRTSDDTTT